MELRAIKNPMINTNWHVFEQIDSTKSLSILFMIREAIVVLFKDNGLVHNLTL